MDSRTDIRAMEVPVQLLVDGVTDYAIFMLDAAGKVASWNRGAQRIKGYRADEIIGHDFSIFYPAAERIAGKPARELEIAASSGRYEEEGWRVRKDGSTFWASVVISAIHDDRGRLAGYAKVTRDLTLHKQSEERQHALMQRLTLALKVSGAGVWDWDIKRNVFDCDEAMCGIFGITPRASIDYGVWRRSVLPEDLDGLEAGLRIAITQKQPQSRMFRILHPVHGIRFVEADCTIVLDEAGNVVRVIGVILDITQRERAAEALRQSTAQLNRGLQLLSKQHQEISVLGELGETLQKCADMDEVRAPIRNFMPILFPESSGCFYLLHASGKYLDVVADWGNFIGSAPIVLPADCWGIRKGEACWSDARDGLRCRHLDPPEQRGLSLCVPSYSQGDTLGLLLVRPSIATASEAESQTRQPLERMASMTADRIGVAVANIKLRDSLRQQSIRDPLTGQFNRRYLEESIDREISRAARDRSCFAVLMIDADHFKRFNDTYGHHVGDRVLRGIGDALAGACRASDLVCRFGGEEFVALLPAITPEQAMAKAELIRDAVKRMDPVAMGTLTQTVTVSIGVALFPANGQTRDGILKAADEALYTAKKAGRDCVAFASTRSPLELIP